MPLLGAQLTQTRTRRHKFQQHTDVLIERHRGGRENFRSASERGCSFANRACWGAAVVTGCSFGSGCVCSYGPSAAAGASAATGAAADNSIVKDNVACCALALG